MPSASNDAGSYKILIVSSAQLVAEFGAAQLALNLAQALRARGVNVRLWSPIKNSTRITRFNRLRKERKALTRFVEMEGPFDVVDAPAYMITRRLSKLSLCIARSVQPQLHYEWVQIRYLRVYSLRDVARMGLALVNSAIRSWQQLRGWVIADFIYCLGTNEKDWMAKWFPVWRRKLASYVAAIANDEQESLRKIRQTRRPRQECGTRFIWIGRWIAHKGTHRLIEFMQHRLSIYPLDTFTLAGCGPGPLKGLPEALRNDHRVMIVSEYARSDLPEMLSCHDAGLFTSVAEGWGLVLNEMLESGLPVYAVKEGGVKDLQPYFSDALRPFPPKQNIIAPQTNSVDWESYYTVFRWDSIAQIYIETIKTAGLRCFSR